MTQVRDEHIRNTRKIFFNLPDAQNLVAIRSMMYIGKEVVVRSPNQCPPKQRMLTAFSNNNPRPPSGVIMTNKKAIVNSLHLLLPEDIMEETHTSTNKTTGEITNKTAMNKDGELRLWLKIALDEEKWITISESSNNQEYQSSLPIPINHNDNRIHKPITSTMMNQTITMVTNESKIHRPLVLTAERGGIIIIASTTTSSIPSASHYINDYNPDNVGRTAHDSLRVMGLRNNATLREIRTQF